VKYPDDLEVKIGFDQIRQKLRDLCMGEPVRFLVDKMKFNSNYEIIHNSINQTREFQEIFQNETDYPLGYYEDINHILSKAEIIGSYIEASDINNIKRSLESIKSFINFFKKREDQEYPFLRKLTIGVKIFPLVLDSISKVINNQGVIKDNASVELEKIRKKIIEKQSDVFKLLSARLKKAQNDGIVEKDVELSVREGRMVIPVQSAFKRKIPGIIHGESATGKTSYIEPANIVEINNSVKELQFAEKREIIKILISFTDNLRPYLGDLKNGGGFLAKLDFIKAKAQLSISLDAIMPDYSDDSLINWNSARHPLLFLSYSGESKKVIPLSLKLTGDNRILLISGPNAGGKSVCLKTVGIIQYMFQCGLMVPMGIKSKMGIFKKMFIDIGDEQSIENDMSTYSSHLINMKFFLKNSDKQSLLLIDEFGTGTEPLLGGSIAESILTELNKKSCFGVITTHYSNLKHFASTEDGIINGAMLFDSVKMQPLFELSIGKPGSSFAFEIAGKIGLPQDLLSEAANRIGKKHISFDKHLRDIERDKRYWEKKRKNIRKEEKNLEDLIKIFSSEIEGIKSNTKNILNEARVEAESVLSGVNKIIEKTIKDIKEGQAEKNRTKEIRKELEKSTNQLIKKTEENAIILNKIKKISDKEKKILKGPSLKKIITPEKPAIIERTHIQKGDKVILIGQDVTGVVIELDDDRAIVSIGNMKTSLKRERLRKISNSEFKKLDRSPSQIKNDLFYDISRKHNEFSSNIDVRGLKADEAIQKVSDFIDEAIMLNKTDHFLSVMVIYPTF